MLSLFSIGCITSMLHVLLHTRQRQAAAISQIHDSVIDSVIGSASTSIPSSIPSSAATAVRPLSEGRRWTLHPKHSWDQNASGKCTRSTALSQSSTIILQRTWYNNHFVFTTEESCSISWTPCGTITPLFECAGNHAPSNHIESVDRVPGIWTPGSQM